MSSKRKKKFSPESAGAGCDNPTAPRVQLGRDQNKLFYLYYRLGALDPIQAEYLALLVVSLLHDAFETSDWWRQLKPKLTVLQVEPTYPQDLRVEVRHIRREVEPRLNILQANARVFASSLWDTLGDEVKIRGGSNVGSLKVDYYVWISNSDRVFYTFNFRR